MHRNLFIMIRGIFDAMASKEVTDEKLEKYFRVTGEALGKVRISIAGDFEEEKDWNAVAEDFLDMAKRYYADAGYFREKGEIVTAFAALNYAHGWLDAGARLGLFDVGKDSRLFTGD